MNEKNDTLFCVYRMEVGLIGFRELRMNEETDKLQGF